MLASELRGPGDIGLSEIAEPAPQPGQLLVRMLAAGICGSDLATVRTGEVTFGVPTLPGSSGHEFVGEVVESRAGRSGAAGFGADQTSGYRPGDRVLVLPPDENGFAEYLAVPPEACLPVPEGLAPDVAVLAQQVGTVVHALRSVGSLLDRTITVIGLGPAGLAFVALAAGMGARAIYGIEPRAARRAAALRLGADAVVDPAADAPATALVALTEGGTDLVIDAAGGQEPIDLAIEVARPYGAVLQFGLPDHATTFDHEGAFRRQLTTYRSVYAQEEPNLACFRLALKLLVRGSFPASDFVSHRLPLCDFTDAIRLAADPGGDALKVLLVPRGLDLPE